MTTRKRRLTSGSLSQPTKRHATATAVTQSLDDDEDSIESILAQIKAQEESEALARKLQQEWNLAKSTSGPSTSRVSAQAPRPSTSYDAGDNVIEISDDEDVPENDEEMARRLAREWGTDNEVQILSGLRGPSSESDKGKSKSASVSQLPPLAKIDKCRDIFVGDKSCSSCGAKIASPRGHVMFTHVQIPPPSLLRLLHIFCTSCRRNHCRGCMSPVSCSQSCKGSAGNHVCPVETCCTNVRAIAIFEALGGFDKQYIGERETSDQRAREAAAKANRYKVGSVGPGGTGYGMDSHHGASALAFSFYGGRGRGRSRGRGTRNQDKSGKTAFPLESLALDSDRLVVHALQTITHFLPAPYDDNPQIYDMLPHHSLDALLSLSQLPDLLGSLLRNDSVTDWIKRMDVYHTMLALLRRMADCELTLEVLIGPRWEVAKSNGIEDHLWLDSEITFAEDANTGAPVRVPPLHAHFTKLTRQCEAFLAGAAGMLSVDHAGDHEAAETTVKATSLCSDIIAARSSIERAMAVMGKDPAKVLQNPDEGDASPDTASASSPSGKNKGKNKSQSTREGPSGTSSNKGKARDPAVDLERTYARECERLAFQYAELSQPSADARGGLVFPAYNYARELEQTAGARRNPKDRLHLVQEYAVMATSLPPGVWVRVDEVRIDMVKIMIAGPEGTPYAGGLFEFDCFIPIEYPHKPPLMHLRTTGGGAVRFNPNLYNNGKVCLSLLGTWPGRPEEQWSSKSTLLQVLVSIQSMILVELPFFNEPGYGKADPRNERSIAYNKNICLQTTRCAIVDWLKDEHKDSVWGEVISSHFLIRRHIIRKCIEAWAIAQPAIRNYVVNDNRNNRPPYLQSAFEAGVLSPHSGFGLGHMVTSHPLHPHPMPQSWAMDGDIPMDVDDPIEYQQTAFASAPIPAPMPALMPNSYDLMLPQYLPISSYPPQFYPLQLGNALGGPSLHPNPAMPMAGPGAYAHVHTTRSKTAASQAPSQMQAPSRDLLAEFDSGIERVRGWGLVGAGEQE